MKLMSDVDGVLVEFSRPFAEWIQRENPDLEIDLDQWGFGLPKEQVDGFIVGFWSSGELRSLPFFPDALEGINSLKSLFEIHLVTALAPEYEPYRVENLKDVKYDSLTVAGWGKRDYVIDVVKPVVALEDKPELIKEFSDAGIDVFYPLIPITKGLGEYGTCYTNWQELIIMIKGKYDNF